MAPHAVCEHSVPHRFRNLGDVDEVADQGMVLAASVGFGPEKRMAWSLIHFSIPPESDIDCS